MFRIFISSKKMVKKKQILKVAEHNRCTGKIANRLSIRLCSMNLLQPFFERMRIFLLTVIILSYCWNIGAQTTEGYKFEIIKKLESTPVKDQMQTGTCWSFATLSLLESEIIRIKGETFNLSEMFIVNRTYYERAIDYVRFHGHQKFSGGAEGWDVFYVWKKYGIVPESVYKGLNYGTNEHKHKEMDAVLKGYIEALVKSESKPLTTAWPDGFNGILDAYLGKIPAKFEYNDKEYTPKSFAKETGINPNNYISIGSYTHHPFYKQFVFEGPDNWAYGRIYNVPLDELMEIVYHSINNGYTIGWCSDVSDNGFAFSTGIAIVPDDELNKDINQFVTPGKEPVISQEMRQKDFDNYSTTEDHLMHVIGLAKDQNGTKYFIVKNSWGKYGSKYNGYFYASEAFARFKTVSIIVNQEAIPKNIAKKLNIK